MHWDFSCKGCARASRSPRPSVQTPARARRVQRCVSRRPQTWPCQAQGRIPGLRRRTHCCRRRRPHGLPGSGSCLTLQRGFSRVRRCTQINRLKRKNSGWVSSEVSEKEGANGGVSSKGASRRHALGPSKVWFDGEPAAHRPSAKSAHGPSQKKLHTRHGKPTIMCLPWAYASWRGLAMVAGQSCIAGPSVGFPVSHTRLLCPPAPAPAKEKRHLPMPPDGQNASAGAFMPCPSLCHGSGPSQAC
jgi:hypothetical protein